MRLLRLLLGLPASGVLLLLVLAACDAPTAPRSGGGTPAQRRAAQCARAQDMMHHPARYNAGDPMHAEMTGRRMWGKLGCGSGGTLDT